MGLICALTGALNDLTPATRDMGEFLLNSIHERFRTSTTPDGQKWKPLAASTLAARARAAGETIKSGKNAGRYTKRAALVVAGSKPLIFSGVPMGTLGYRADKQSV